MKRYVAIIAFALTITSVSSMHGPIKAQTSPDYGLPDLHVIKQAVLSPSYSCRSSADFQMGYQNTALFLSTYSKQFNAPDLLFNGACGSPDYFESSTAGDDMALVADLGRGVDLASLSAQLAFNTKNIFQFTNYSNFAMAVPVEKKHSYAVLVNKATIRGLFVFTVTKHIPNQEVDLDYAVQEYEIMNVAAQSPGFDWSKGNN